MSNNLIQELYFIWNRITCVLFLFIAGTIYCPIHSSVSPQFAEMEFRLLTLNSATSSTTGHNIITDNSTTITNTITVDGSTWTLTNALSINDNTNPLPRYACISYKWGLDRQPHALFPGKSMSLHTLPSLVTAIRSTSSGKNYTAFWTDVFCVPPQEGPARQATLENLGWIYANAAEVIVVLGSETFAVLRDMIESGVVVGEDKLSVLEADEWVRSVWTYQEVVNAKAVRFVSEVPQLHEVQQQQNWSGDAAAVSNNTGVPPSISFTDFFNALGYSLEKFRQSHTDLGTLGVAKRFPNLNVLEDVLADLTMGSYTRYSALTVFRNVCIKHNDMSANYFYAIFGALSDEPRSLEWPSPLPEQQQQALQAGEVDGSLLAEKMMEICEGKGDFSYIYTVAARDTDVKRRWRPKAMDSPSNGEGAPDVLRPILVFYHWGEAQSGMYDEHGDFWLHHMTIMRCVDLGEVSDDGRKGIVRWLGKSALSSLEDDMVLAEFVYKAFLSAGFEGQAEPLVVPDGLVFTLQFIDSERVTKIVISNEIRFSQGAPGLVQYRDSDDEKRYCPCIFIGSTKRLVEPGESVLL